MNLFRLIGDLSHLLAIFLLLIKIWRSRSCAGEVGCAVIEVLNSLKPVKVENSQTGERVCLSLVIAWMQHGRADAQA